MKNIKYHVVKNILILVFLTFQILLADDGYKMPPKAIADLVDDIVTSFARSPRSRSTAFSSMVSAIVEVPCAFM